MSGASLPPGSWGQEQHLQTLILCMFVSLQRRLQRSQVVFQSWWGKGEQAGFVGGACVIVPCLLRLPAPTPSLAPGHIAGDPGT